MFDQKSRYIFVAAFLLFLSFAQLPNAAIINIHPISPPYAICVGLSDVHSDGLIDQYAAQLDMQMSIESASNWYAGSISKTHVPYWVAASLQTTIKTPNGAPGSQEYYYVLISCFDNYASYDQIGFCAIDGHWGLTWSWTEHDFVGNLIYHFDPDAMILKQNTYYTIMMRLLPGSGGYLKYEVYENGQVIWNKAVRTHGGYFILTDYQLVGFRIYRDFTNYEEIQSTDAESPDFHFLFENTKRYDGGWSYFDGWNELYYYAPSGVDVFISTQAHYIYITNPDGP
jgi:hypothetical protein